MRMADLAGKRKRKLPTCPNPLFVHWLTEWKNEAAERGLKTQYTYGKALKTLLKYPLLLASGKECCILEFFGAKICEMLDKKLEEYVGLYGTTEPLPGVIDEKLCRIAQNGSKPKKAKPAPREKVLSESNSTAASSSVPHRKTPKKNQPYLPKYRSGPYALILTLYAKMQDGIPYMAKRDVMIEAQPLADASFTVPDPGSRYTAWSSMGSLINKGYVLKDGSPARYGLTEEGMSLAECIASHNYGNDDQEIARNSQETYGSNPATNSTISSHTSALPSIVQHSSRPALPEIRTDQNSRTIHGLSDSEEEDDTPVPLASRLASEQLGTAVHVSSSNATSSAGSVYESYARPKIFQFCFVNDNGAEVMTKDAAAVTVDEEISIGFLVKCDYEDLVTSGKRFKLLPGRSCNNQITAYIHNDDIPEVCPNSTDMGSAASALSVTTSHVETSSVPKNPTPVIPAKKTSSKPPQPSSSSSRNYHDGTSRVLPSTSTADTFPRPAALRHSPVSDSSSVHTLQSLSQQSTTSYASDLTEPDFQFLPGTFEIVLCIDNHEQYGKGKFNKQILGNELEKHGIKYDVRLLHVGDFLWIARPKGYRLAGDINQELVLDYVIERKRIDDMASSIIDGRYKEQKFRLKSCGLGVPMLLVEDCPNSYCSIPHKSLMQAATNTQVIDKFQIIKTKDLRDSFNFLINMTKFLQRTYKYKTLKAHSKVDLQTNNIVNQPKDAVVRLMTFPDFNRASAKVKPLSVKEAFARQLVCIHGITPEKVAVILAEYPTPACLRIAYRECDSETDREMLLSLLKMPKTNKRVVLPQVSKHIYKLLTVGSED